MNGTILCGVDGSEASDRVAGVAARLAEGMGSEVALAHVHPPRGLFQRLAAPRAGRWSTRRTLRAIPARHRFPPTTGTYLTTGDPVDELLRLAAAVDTQLIVVGSRGLREVGSALLGSVSSALMASAPSPVVVVPPDTPVRRYPAELSSVVCGVEGSDRDADVLRLGADLVNRLGGTLHAVHAFDVRTPTAVAAPYAPPLPELHEMAEDRLARTLVETGVSARGHVLALPPVAALTRIAEEQRAGLIAVGSHGRGKLGSVLLGSVTIRLAAEGRTPVVVLPPQAPQRFGA